MTVSQAAEWIRKRLQFKEKFEVGSAGRTVLEEYVDRCYSRGKDADGNPIKTSSIQIGYTVWSQGGARWKPYNFYAQFKLPKDDVPAGPLAYPQCYRVYLEPKVMGSSWSHISWESACIAALMGCFCSTIIAKGRK